jgi:hypothetical protein
MKRLAPIAFLVACADPSPASVSEVDASEVDVPDGAADVEVEVTPDPIEGPMLGLNDLTFLLPPGTLPAPLLPVEDLLDEAVFADLVTASGEVFTDFADFVPVAVRFDLCDRDVPGPCPIDADGSLRVVLQPIIDPSATPVVFEDVAVHAFYPIPKGELALLVTRLRALADLGQIPLDTPLRPNPALNLDPNGAYRTALAELVQDYAAPERVVRLTVFAQFSMRAALVWLFRGVERSSLTEPLAPIIIPGVEVAQQDVLLVGQTSYEVTPVVDSPPGVELALSEYAFAAATSEQQANARRALQAIDDPATHSASTTQCANCHVTTQLALHREAGPFETIGPFTPRPFDPEQALDRSLRNLGYVFQHPVVSQRAANETATVATELEARFPSTR